MPKILDKETTEDISEKERFGENRRYSLHAAYHKAEWTNSYFLNSYVTAASLQNWSAIRNRCRSLTASELSKVIQASYDAELSDIKSDKTVLIRVASLKNPLETFYRTDSLPLKNRNKTLAKFADKLSNARSSEPDFARRVAQEFERYARRIIAVQSIRLVSVNIRKWTSLEDRTWKQLIIDFMVETKPEIALALWDNLSDELSTFVRVQYRREASELHELLSVTVRW
jgi:hypothetical protein